MRIHSFKLLSIFNDGNQASSGQVTCTEISLSESPILKCFLYDWCSWIGAYQLASTGINWHQLASTLREGRRAYLWHVMQCDAIRTSISIQSTLTIRNPGPHFLSSFLSCPDLHITPIHYGVLPECRIWKKNQKALWQSLLEQGAWGPWSWNPMQRSLLS